ncbi:MAG: hypothetical protein IPM82_04350 [Saprospiraceae bacterium]|nr:hypothetical protein [Saprospiraceae bacterium]
MDNRYKIGIVEEEAVWVETFKRKLKDDFDVYVFELLDTTKTQDIVEKIESEQLDCIIADYELNETAVVGFNGDKLIEDVKSLSSFSIIYYYW